VSGALVVVAAAQEAGHIPRGLTVVVTGAGKTAAAVATTRAVLEHRPDRVYNLGSAGALRDGLSGCYEIGTVINHDINAAVVRSLGLDPHETLTIGPGETVLASGDVFVTDARLRDRLAARAHLVDMEGYAVAYACVELGVPLTMVKHVSDNADESALDWAATVHHSARALGRWLDKHL
jgi:adenosylhomocysteine nucleosidase